MGWLRSDRDNASESRKAFILHGWRIPVRSPSRWMRVQPSCEAAQLNCRGKLNDRPFLRSAIDGLSDRIWVRPRGLARKLIN